MDLEQIRKAVEARLNKVLAVPYLSEGTYLPDWAETKEANAKHLEEKLPKSSVAVSYIATGYKLPVFLTLENGEEFYFVHSIVGNDPDLIQYGVRVIHYTLTGIVKGKVCGQVSVIRNKTFAPSKGLPKFIFKEILFPKYKRVLSDSTHSTDGRGFWEERIMEALQEGKKVSSLEIEGETVVSITPVKSVADMDQYYSTGQDYKGYYYRFLIE